jgi:hypothetical protein
LSAVLIIQMTHGGLGGFAQFAADVAAEEVGEEQGKSGRRRDLGEAESDQRDEDPPETATPNVPMIAQVAVPRTAVVVPCSPPAFRANFPATYPPKR